MLKYYGGQIQNLGGHNPPFQYKPCIELWEHLEALGSKGLKWYWQIQTQSFECMLIFIICMHKIVLREMQT